jgi:hypothetical protein
MVSIDFHEFSEFVMTRVSNIWEFNGDRFSGFLFRMMSRVISRFSIS